MPPAERKEAVIVIAGQAGQGIQTIETVLTRVLKRSGYRVFATKEYMSRIRGGANSALIRVGQDNFPANVDRIDILVPLDASALDHLSSRISAETLIIGDRDALRSGREIVDISFTRIAEDAGGKIYANTAAVAVICGALEGDLGILEEYLSGHFGGKGEQVVEANLQAARRGYEKGCGLRSSGKVALRLERDAGVAEHILLSGAEAVTLGAVSGGCRFVSSYPMSPGTSVLTRMAEKDARFGVVVEQAEDEIAAVNMAIGAWYAGGRAMVTTSGGGFDLMQEGLSLAGITETPLVVHLGQRPGPATGMATRTEQADLDLALYSGHGEFPRIIYAPGRAEEAFELTHRAFDAADRYQVPVFILTDQYFLDSMYTVPGIDVEAAAAENHTVQPRSGYRRYAFTGSGVSPRGLPGTGDGCVRVDSHEHTEDGHITEEIDLRNRMMEKRMGKADLIASDTVPPTLIGPEDHETLVVCWGSNYHIAAEAVSLLKKRDVAALHFPQVYPLPRQARQFLEKAQKTVVVENNYTGQFARLLRTHTGCDPGHSIRRYDGRPMCSRALAGEILRILEKGGSR